MFEAVAEVDTEDNISWLIMASATISSKADLATALPSSWLAVGEEVSVDVADTDAPIAFVLRVVSGSIVAAD